MSEDKLGLETAAEATNSGLGNKREQPDKFRTTYGQPGLPGGKFKRGNGRRPIRNIPRWRASSAGSLDPLREEGSLAMASREEKNAAGRKFDSNNQPQLDFPYQQNSFQKFRQSKDYRPLVPHDDQQGVQQDRQILTQPTYYSEAKGESADGEYTSKIYHGPRGIHRKRNHQNYSSATVGNNRLYARASRIIFTCHTCKEEFPSNKKLHKHIPTCQNDKAAKEPATSESFHYAIQSNGRASFNHEGIDSALDKKIKVEKKLDTLTPEVTQALDCSMDSGIYSPAGGQKRTREVDEASFQTQRPKPTPESRLDNQVQDMEVRASVRDYMERRLRNVPKNLDTSVDEIMANRETRTTPAFFDVNQKSRNTEAENLIPLSDIIKTGSGGPEANTSISRKGPILVSRGNRKSTGKDETTTRLFKTLDQLCLQHQEQFAELIKAVDEDEGAIDGIIASFNATSKQVEDIRKKHAAMNEVVGR